METIDLIRTSASRPNFLKISTASIAKNLKFSGKIRWIIHEDQLDKARSDECMVYIQTCGIYDMFKRDKPPIGQGPSLTWLMSRANTKYILNFEDDWELLKEIDVDKLIKLMDDNQDINQIAFHKRPIMSEKPKFKKKQVFRDGIPLVTSPHWCFTPSIYRMSFLKPKW